MKILLKAFFLLVGLVASGFVWQRQSAQRRARSLEALMLSFDEEQIRTLFETLFLCEQKRFLFTREGQMRIGSDSIQKY